MIFIMFTALFLIVVTFHIISFSQITVNYNGEETRVSAFLNDAKKFDKDIDNDVLMIDVKEFYKSIGAEVSENHRGIFVRLSGDSIFISKLDPAATKNGESMELSSTVENIMGLAFLSVKDVAKISELHSAWDNSTKTLRLQTLAYREENPVLPYYIMVNKTEGSMLIYRLDELDEYTILVQEYPVFTGKTNMQTPVGTFTINSKELWKSWGNNVYSKYTSNYAEGLYIHTPLYKGMDDDKMMMSTVSDPTAGCIKTSTENCQWIYENCPIGTIVEIISDQ